MELHLQADGEAVFEDLLGKPAGLHAGEFSGHSGGDVGGGEQDFVSGDLAASDELARPRVVLFGADDEFHFVRGFQMFQDSLGSRRGSFRSTEF